MTEAGYPVSVWGNGPGDRYAPHAHAYRKHLCCLEGSIVFHTASMDHPLSPGDRLTLDPGTEHSATVGPAGVRCAEAHA
jgi:quercetin dioxygenase-like cupin family protein